MVQRISTVCLAFVLLCGAGAAVSEGSEALTLEGLDARLKQLEQLPERVEFQDPSTVMTVGGQIQIDAVYGWPETNGLMIAKNIEIPEPSGEAGQLYTSARESRIWFKTRTVTELGVVRTLIEVDFRGTSGTETATNGHGLRLRHAYVDVDGWAVGQTNSLFNTPTRLETLSYPINDALIRQPLVRYRQSRRTMSWEVALEQPETTLYEPGGAILSPSDDRLPDLTARVRYFAPWGEAALSMLGRYIVQERAVLKDGTALPEGDSAVGWGGNLSTRIGVGARDDLRFDAQYGVGLGRYVGFGSFAAGRVDVAGNIALSHLMGGHLGYRHWWAERWRSTLAVAVVAADHPEGTSGQATKRAHSVAVNVIYTPLKQIRVGMEYAHGSRELESGRRGDLDQFKTILRYVF